MIQNEDAEKGWQRVPRQPLRLYLFLLPAFLGLSVVTLALVAFGAYGFLDRILITEETENLETQSLILSGEFNHFFSEGQQAMIDPRCDALGKATGYRYTVILKDGRVLGDSAVNPDTMESHLSRPEVQKAMQGQLALDIRESGTTGVTYLFAAVPLGDGQVIGVLRIARPYNVIRGLSRTIYFRFLIGILLVLALALLFSLGLSRWLAGLFRWFVAFVKGVSPDGRPGRMSTTKLFPLEAFELKEAILELLARLSGRVAALDRLAYSDSLTGLSNRARLYELLDKLLTRAGAAGHFALFFFDLDRFKDVNDGYGHQAGDRLLKEMARRLQGFSDQQRHVARLGGDEFCLLVDASLTRTEATNLARAIRKSLACPFVLGPEEIRISASIGIAFFPQDGTSRPQLLRAADMAMYEAKRQNGEGFAFAGETVETATPSI